MDREQVGAAALGEIEWQPFVALGTASQPAGPEQEPAAGVGIQALDGADHGLLKGREQKPVVSKPSRRLRDHLGLVPGLLDLDVHRDPAGAEIEDGVEGGRLVAAEPDQPRVGQQRQWHSPSGGVVMHDENAVRGPAHIELHSIGTQGDRRVERRKRVLRRLA